MTLKLNLGAGDHPLPGYVNIDKKYDPSRDHCEPVCVNRSIFPLTDMDESADEIRASHILEHFPYWQVQDVLMDWARALKPGGTLKIAVPDFEKIAQWYVEEREFLLLGYLFGGQTDENDYHKTTFDTGLLTELLEKCGLQVIGTWKSEIQDGASLPVSLNLEAIKPLPGQDYPLVVGGQPVHIPVQESAEPEEFSVSLEDVGKQVRAVITSPRLGFTDANFHAVKALSPYRIVMDRRGGVFWGQSLTKLIETAIEDGLRYVLTLDYDTVFSHEDVARLYAIMETHTEIDALCALQMRRESESPLFTLSEFKQGAPREITLRMDDLMQETLPIRSGHFGLTMLRTEKFAALPKPWFHAKPDEEGRWGDGRYDEDIHFWLKWRDAGNTLYLANRVVIGHLELMVTWPNREMKPIYQGTQDYENNGKPIGVWR